jgi:hypothetical protein
LPLELRGSREEVGRRGTQIICSAGIAHLAGNVETQLRLGTPITAVPHEAILQASVAMTWMSKPLLNGPSNQQGGRTRSGGAG